MWLIFYRTIAPTNNPFVSAAAFGEGWHNYHHVFPWDYKTSELGDYSLNMTTGFIDLFAKIGRSKYTPDWFCHSPNLFKINVSIKFQVGHMIWRPYPKKLFENAPNERVMVHDILLNALTGQILCQLTNKAMIITIIAVIIEIKQTNVWFGAGTI